MIITDCINVAASYWVIVVLCMAYIYDYILVFMKEEKC